MLKRMWKRKSSCTVGKCKQIQSLWKALWRFLKKLGIKLLFTPILSPGPGPVRGMVTVTEGANSERQKPGTDGNLLQSIGKGEVTINSRLIPYLFEMNYGEQKTVI